MDAPKPILITPEKSEQKLTLNKSKEFKLFENNKEYAISFGKSSNFEKLGFNIKELSLESTSFYEFFYSLDELQKINKYFRIFDNIDEVISIIGEIFEDKNVNLKFCDNSLFLIFKINKMGRGEELISLELKKNTLSSKEISEKLLKEINILKKKLEEIDEIKNEIKILKEENKTKDLLLAELINWKNKIENKEGEILSKDSYNPIINSEIFEKKEELDMICNRLNDMQLFKNKKISFRLIFRATRDGHFPKNFHQKCDGIDKTITIIKTIKNIKFGGYIHNKWESKGGWIIDDDCFVFSINNKKIYNSINGSSKYYFSTVHGPNFIVFGLVQDFFEKTSYNICTQKTASLYFSGFTFDYEINGGEKEFQAQEIEVFQIIV